jgi:NADH-quinone oxidoreductase subunit J
MMPAIDLFFYLASGVAVVSTLAAITRVNAVHSLLYMVTSLLSVAIVFYVLGAPYIAALQAIVYAGAIMVLFVFVIMMLNQGPQAADTERQWLSPRTWVGPSILAGILLGEMVLLLFRDDPAPLAAHRVVDAREVSLALFGPYILVIELASLLLLAGLIGAYHLGRREPEMRPAEDR